MFNNFSIQKDLIMTVEKVASTKPISRTGMILAQQKAFRRGKYSPPLTTMDHCHIEVAAPSITV
eukprot:m.48193 g.48193  ORF g.48193 m.48193 type:complete len:64 (-) comp13275_c0_seq1:215-406(-)